MPKLPRSKTSARDTESHRDVAARWTPRLAKRGWTPVSNFFLKNHHRLKISHIEAMVVIHIISFKWDHKLPFPALKTIAKRMGITPTSVRAHLRSLEAKGFLRRLQRVGTTNRFDLMPLFEALENLMAEDRVARKATADAGKPSKKIRA